MIYFCTQQVAGITLSVMEKALSQAKDGRKIILSKFPLLHCKILDLTFKFVLVIFYLTFALNCCNFQLYN